MTLAASSAIRKRNLSKSTAAVDGVAEPLACDLALNSKEVL